MICHLCRREREARHLVPAEDARTFCQTDVVGCYFLACLALGIPQWQAARAKGTDAGRIRQARRAA